MFFWAGALKMLRALRFQPHRLLAEILWESLQPGCCRCEKSLPSSRALLRIYARIYAIDRMSSLALRRLPAGSCLDESYLSLYYSAEAGAHGKEPHELPNHCRS